MAQCCMHAYVSGRVQGVYFRQSTLEQATQLGLHGWVGNLDDGRVEVLFEGEETAVLTLAAWLQQGPSNAQVSGLEMRKQPMQGLSGFVVRR